MTLLVQHFPPCVGTDIVSMDVALLVQHFLSCVGTDIVSMDVALLVQHFLSCVGTYTVFNNSKYGRGTIIYYIFEISGSKAANFYVIFLYSQLHHTFNNLKIIANVNK